MSIIAKAELILTTQHSKTSYRQDAQLSQRDRATGCVIVFAKSRRLELGYFTYFTDIIGLSSTTVI